MIPADRLRQLRAIFAKSRRHIKRDYPEGPARLWTPGLDNISTYVESRPYIAREFRRRKREGRGFINDREWLKGLKTEILAGRQTQRSNRRKFYRMLKKMRDEGTI